MKEDTFRLHLFLLFKEWQTHISTLSFVQKPQIIRKEFGRNKM